METYRHISTSRLHCNTFEFPVIAEQLHPFLLPVELELELELIQTQMAQKPMLRAEVGMGVRCANNASAE
jgi:hypothetical protein